ncbi:hypothetical protein CPG37_02790 [Malaciobacter canalis]|uniref:Transcriptional regulator n=1 Tax=Malaciobacter canalis TaxID=1912871 RepID=A0ABX4LSP3_9BACT|nr:LapA family protein [Malaciobacter canalis]PHO10788.1 hypothetical protein CPG37_02790 [Malaciobacter canalis]QEE33945.1 hypothetical protein ACAN_2507 [Malaciobacter canalis]
MRDIKFNNELIYKLESIYAQDGLTKVDEKDIAKAMGMSPSQFSRDKNNDQVPYKYLIPYCLDKEVDINWILDSNINSLYIIEHTSFIKKWTRCRSNLLARIRGKYNKDCEKRDVFLNRKSKENETEQDIYNYYNLSKTFLGKYEFRIVLWIIIAFFIGCLLGFYLSSF